MAPIEVCKDCMHKEMCKYRDAMAVYTESDFIKDYGDLPMKVTIECELRDEDKNERKTSIAYKQGYSRGYNQAQIDEMMKK